MLEQLKSLVCNANLDLVAKGVVIYTWGNVSELDLETGFVVIKPSGVSYDRLKAKDMVVVDRNGNRIDGKLSASSDLRTHLAIYRAFNGICGIAHTHSKWATAWAQSGLDVPAMGTTHADTFYGTVPCARFLTQEEICEI